MILLFYYIEKRVLQHLTPNLRILLNQISIGILVTWLDWILICLGQVDCSVRFEMTQCNWPASHDLVLFRTCYFNDGSFSATRHGQYLHEVWNLEGLPNHCMVYNWSPGAYRWHHGILQATSFDACNIQTGAEFHACTHKWTTNVLSSAANYDCMWHLPMMSHCSLVQPAMICMLG